MDISGVARIASLPRTTVVRHLNMLEEEGFLRFSRNQRWVFPVPFSHKAVIDRHLYDDLELIITRTGRYLSEMDT
ncbi:helix-turn-helix domain-containing protein [Brucella sp. 2716]|uniref:helix-turn-helix domain-containing protein n=1 Tax=Brucella sp. 2716 TaxID=2975052 RepID=UPI0038F7BB78